MLNYQACSFQKATCPVRKYKERMRGYGAPRLDWRERVICKYSMFNCVLLLDRVRECEAIDMRRSEPLVA
jgi:hypothetical protein